MFSPVLECQFFRKMASSTDSSQTPVETSPGSVKQGFAARGNFLEDIWQYPNGDILGHHKSASGM